MSLKINSRAARFTCENTHGKINPCQRMPEVDADGDLLRRSSPSLHPVHQETTMFSTDQPLESPLPELPYGSVWLIGAAGSDRRHLSPLAVHALSTADALIHDPGIGQEILDLVKRYREVGSAGRAIERAITLAEDGWRVVQLTESDTMERAVACATRCAERNVPFRVVPNASEPLGGDAPLGLVLVHKSMSVGGADPQPTLVLLIATPRSDAPAGITPRRRPLDFSMSGLAG